MSFLTSNIVYVVYSGRRIKILLELTEGKEGGTEPM